MKQNMDSSQHIVLLAFVSGNRYMQHITSSLQLLHERLWTHLCVDPIELAFCVVNAEMVLQHITTVRT